MGILYIGKVKKSNGSFQIIVWRNLYYGSFQIITLCINFTLFSDDNKIDECKRFRSQYDPASYPSMWSGKWGALPHIKEEKPVSGGGADMTGNTHL